MKVSNAYRRICWAEEQFDELHERARVFFATYEYTRVGHTDAKGIESFDKIRFNDPLPDWMARLTVQIVENLRSALDHATTATIRTVSHRKRSGFPFGDTKRKFNADLAGDKCKHVPDEIKTLLRTFKPYKRGNPPLWALNKICNPYKHRNKLLRPGVGVKNVRFDSPYGQAIEVFKPYWNGRKNEIVLSPTASTSQHDVEFSVTITFDKVPFFGGEPVFASLRYLTRIVKSVVLGIEAEMRRLNRL